MCDKEWWYTCNYCEEHIDGRTVERSIEEIDGSLFACVKCPSCGKMVKVNYLTFELLYKIIEKNNIPHDVNLMSDSGWECYATEMGCIYYNESENVIVFTQKESKYDVYYNDKNWRILK